MSLKSIQARRQTHKKRIALLLGWPIYDVDIFVDKGVMELFIDASIADGKASQRRKKRKRH